MFSVEQLVCNGLYESLAEPASVVEALSAPTFDLWLPNSDLIGSVDIAWNELTCECERIPARRRWLNYLHAHETEVRLSIGLSYSFEYASLERLIPNSVFPTHHCGARFLRDWDQFSVFCQLILGVQDFGPLSPPFYAICSTPLLPWISRTITVFDMLQLQRRATIEVKEIGE